MKVRKMSYIVLISDLYLMLTFAYIIYSAFFGFAHIGHESYVITQIPDKIAIMISIIEIILANGLSYLLHKCYITSFRRTTILITVLNISYRILNIIVCPNIFIVFMLIVGLVLLLSLLLY